MSRTDNTRPYWVKVNQDAKYTRHDHLSFGRVHRRYVTVRDKNGRPVMETVPFVVPAYRLVHRGLFGYTYEPLVDAALGRMSSAVRENVFRVARHHVASGRPYEKIVIGTREVYKREVRIISVTADHCTEGAPYPKTFYSNWELPCVPELTTAQYRKLGSGLRAGKLSSALREKNGSDRAYRRAVLGEIKKSWNSGYDIEDYDNEKSLTDQQRRSIQWNLY